MKRENEAIQKLLLNIEDPVRQVLRKFYRAHIMLYLTDNQTLEL